MRHQLFRESQPEQGLNSQNITYRVKPKSAPSPHKNRAFTKKLILEFSPENRLDQVT